MPRHKKESRLIKTRLKMGKKGNNFHLNMKKKLLQKTFM